jgi:hypothetical protein
VTVADAVPETVVVAAAAANNGVAIDAIIAADATAMRIDFFVI